MAGQAKTLTLIFNPHAGFWDWGSLVQQTAQFWRHRGWQVCIEATARPNHATELAAEAAGRGHQLVLAAGGDGTVNEVVNGLVGTETTLALLPVGTANSFAKELGLPRPNFLNWDWLQEASLALSRGRIQRVDVGVCNGRHWLLWAGTGADAFAVEQIEPRSKLFKRLGPAGYAAKALLTLPNFPGMRATVTVDDQVRQDDFLLVVAINCRMYAGGELKLNLGAQLDDGRYEVWLFRGRQFTDLVRYTIAIGMESHMQDPNIEILTGHQVSVVTEPIMPYHLDGEPTGSTPFTCELKAGALRLLAPVTAPIDLFQKPAEVTQL